MSNNSLKPRIETARNFLNIVRFADRKRNIKLEKEAIQLLREIDLYYFEPARGWEFFTADHYVGRNLAKLESIIETMVRHKNKR